MLETLNKSFASNLTAILAAILGIATGAAYFFSEYAANKTTSLVEKELSSKISSVSRDVDQYQASIKSTLNEADELSKRVQAISSTVDNLTTEQIQQKLNEVDGKIGKLTTQVSGLQQIISPQNASEILNVARMSDEILARKKLEDRVDNSLNQTKQSVQAMETKISTLQYWIWGAFITLIGGLLGSVIYLAKLLSTHLISKKQPQKGGEQNA